MAKYKVSDTVFIVDFGQISKTSILQVISEKWNTTQYQVETFKNHWENWKYILPETEIFTDENQTIVHGLKNSGLTALLFDDENPEKANLLEIMKRNSIDMITYRKIQKAKKVEKGLV